MIDIKLKLIPIVSKITLQKIIPNIEWIIASPSGTIKNTNICEIGIRADIKKKKIIVVSVIDNLIKGAGGQAVQAMNIMFGLPETEGLDYLSMYV